MLHLLAQWFDVRKGEGNLVARVGTVLFLIIAGHTLLETARDALFLAQLKPSRLALVYAALAGAVVLAAKVSSYLCERYGEKRALAWTLFFGACGAGLFFLLPKSRSLIFVFYLWTGIMASILVAQFWILSGRVLTIAQAKRLLGPIAAGGILGGVAGGALGAVLLSQLSTSDLLPIAATCFLLATAPLRGITTLSSKQVVEQRQQGQEDQESEEGEGQQPQLAQAWRREHHYVILVALLIATATATLLFLDYLFKVSTARNVEAANLGFFFAAYYGTLNFFAFAFQLFLATHLLRRLGVLASVAVLPGLLVIGSAFTLLVGPALLLVLLVKGADGSLRHSLHRTSLELLWMPLPRPMRTTTKPVVDTFVVRSAQALSAAAIFGLAWWQLDTPRVLAAIIVGTASLWVVLAVLLREPYLALLRSALEDDREVDAPLRLHIDSLQVILEALSSMNPSRAIAGILMLASNRRAELIPALTLFHPDKDVLLRALEHVPAPNRTDWIGPTERLLDHESEEVRFAAMGALLSHGIQQPVEARLNESKPAIRGHAIVLLADRSAASPETHPSVVALLNETGDVAVQSKVALLKALGSCDPSRWAGVIVALLNDSSPEVSDEAVHVASNLKSERLIPALLQRLDSRRQRDTVRDALVHQGDPALTQAAELLQDETTEPRLRRHLPRTISRFANQRAADILLNTVDTDPVGIIRYKALRGLGRLATETRVSLKHRVLEHRLEDNLLEHLRMFTLKGVISSELTGNGQPTDTSGQLLQDLLSDKAAQALERSFRMLQLLNIDADIKSAASAIMSGNKMAHAQAIEYLATLALELKPETAELFRLATDNLEPSARASLARSHFSALPETYAQALAQLVNDPDEDLRSIAEYHLECAGTTSLRQEVARAFSDAAEASMVAKQAAKSAPAIGGPKLAG